MSSAVPKWSGYDYQGKVGLYVVLEYFIAQVKAPVALLQDFTIEYEPYIDSKDFQDFIILEDSKAISVHQVKGMSSYYASSYKTAVSKLKETQNDLSAPEAYLHLAVGLKSPNEQSLDNYLFTYFEGTTKAQKYCAIDKIKLSIIKQLEDFISLHDPSQDAAHVAEVTYIRLVGMLADRIADAHQNKTPLKIDFKDYWDIISVHQETNSPDDYKHAYIDAFYEALEKYCRVQSYEENLKQALFERCDFLIGYDRGQLETFFRLLSPHKYVDHLYRLSSLTKMVPDNELSDVFFPIFDQIKIDLDLEKLMQGGAVYHATKANEYLLATALPHSNTSEGNIKDIVQQIRDNRTINDWLWHCDKMISHSLPVPSIAEMDSRWNHIIPKNYVIPQSPKHAGQHINEIKLKSIIPLSQALKELKHD